MTDDSAYRPRLTALELAHEKLDSELREQMRHSEHIDRKAGRTLQASVAFSSVVSAIVYYLTRQADRSTYGSLDNPLTYVALLFGLSSIILSILTIYHTEMETGLTPSNIEEGARFGRKELLLTMVQTYPTYIDRNSRRLSVDITLLTAGQFSLVLAVVCTVGAVIIYVRHPPVAVGVAGVAFGVLIVWAVATFVTVRQYP